MSVLIVTWNRRDDVLSAVQSVYDQSYGNYEIIVVDNASTDGTVEALHQTFPDVKLIVLDQNLGAASGRNPGITAAAGDLVFLLDSDAILANDTLSRVVNRFWTEPELGVITCKVLNAHSGELDPTGWLFTERDKAIQDLSFPSCSFCEGGAAIRKRVFDQVGLFWDLLFFGREGEELGLRIWDAGYHILYAPESVVYHRASPQKRVAGGRREYFNLRNSLYIYIRHYPWWMLYPFAWLKVATSLIRAIKQKGLRQSLQAIRDVFRQLPSLWKQRKPIRNKTAYRYLQMQREHGSLAWDVWSWFKYKT